MKWIIKIRSAITTTYPGLWSFFNKIEPGKSFTKPQLQLVQSTAREADTLELR